MSTSSPSPPPVLHNRRLARPNALALPRGVRFDTPFNASANTSRQSTASHTTHASAAGSSAPSHGGNGLGTAEPIDLTNDSSDEDEPVIVGENIVNRNAGPTTRARREERANAPSWQRRVADEEYQEAIGDIDRTIERRRAQAEALIRADVQEGRRRDRQINYDAQRRRQDHQQPAPTGPTLPAVPVMQLRRGPLRDDDAWYNPEDDGDEAHDYMGWLHRLQMPRLLDGLGLAGFRMPGLLRRMEEGIAAGYGPAAIGLGVAGPGPGMNGANEVETRIGKIRPVKRDDAEPGFTATFDLDSIDGPIVLDDEGVVAPRNLYLDCALCHDPLLLSAAYASPADRVWVLRCGHMVDQKCLEKLSIPLRPEQIKNTINYISPFPLDEEPPRKKTRGKKALPKNVNKPAIHIYQCPVKSCGREHTAIRKEEEWAQTEDGGAIQSFM